MSSDKLFFIESLGDLFFSVQSQKIFPDSKFFVDCIPRTETSEILLEYEKIKNDPDFDLKLFVTTHFILPPELSSDYLSANKPILQHLQDLWVVLKRTPSIHGGTLISLPYPYIVPGGRFREIFYWDSYFTMLGLQVSKQTDLIQSMIKNFATLIDRFGFIPNGNRTYFLGRSQPPFFSLMLDILAEEMNESVLHSYLPQLEKEYAFWMDGANNLTEPGNSYRRVVRMPDNTVLNRYWDDKDYARPEAFFEDSSVAKRSGRPLEEVQLHLRAACESGWDFSSRWMRDGKTMETIETAHIIPIDLNCLLLHLEETLLKIYTIKQDDPAVIQTFQAAVQNRHSAIQKYCWNEAKGFYFDYQFKDKQQTDKYSLAAAYPLFFWIASPQQAESVAQVLEQKFLSDGGLVTTLYTTGQQWDAPNGWAPLQWIVYKGLMENGFTELAVRMRERWLKNCEKVYDDTGKMMEKYNVVDIQIKAGGGKYPNQDGFGWTNGVYLRMSQDIERGK